MTDKSRRHFIGLTVAAAFVPFFPGRDGFGQGAGKRRVIDVRIEKRKVVAPKSAIRITERETIDLRWSSDEIVHLHLHGYDKELKVQPGKPSVMRITGTATGRFPITSHGWGHSGHGHHALTYLEVHPR